MRLENPHCSVKGGSAMRKLMESLLASSGQDTKADHGTTIGSQGAPDPDLLRSGREGW
jgi:hypothetical protein